MVAGGLGTPLDIVPGLIGLLTNVESVDLIEQLSAVAADALSGRAGDLMAQHISALAELTTERE